MNALRPFIYPLLMTTLVLPAVAQGQTSESTFDASPLLRGKKALTDPDITAEAQPVLRFNWQKELQPPSPLFPEVMGPINTPELPPGLVSLSAQSCNACHQEIHDQWADSAHAKAWVDPIYQAALESTGQANACIHCHTPFTSQQAQKITGFTRGNAHLPITEANETFSPTLQ